MRFNYFDIFTPDSAISSIEQFAGRQPEIDQLSDALQSSGTSIVIYGNRGVGKSSLAQQLFALSQNDKSTIARLTHQPIRRLDFLPITFRADDSVLDISTLLIRILRSNSGLAPWIPLEIKEAVGKLSGGISLSVMGSKVGVERGKETKAERPNIPEDVFSVFQNACEAIVSSGAVEDGLLLIIDEFDRIVDTSGFASLVKSFEGSKVRFSIVGVARDIEKLVEDHQSIARQIAGGSIFVRPMNDEEIKQIFFQAHERMRNEIIFDDGAIQFITACAKGHPYIVHLIGKQALISAARNNQNVVNEEAARLALNEISSSGSNVPLELDYRKAIKSSAPREYILKMFAEEDSEPIRTTEIYDKITEALGIEREAISVYMGHLCNEEYGPVLEKSGERYYRFLNSVFKAYVSARGFELYKPKTG